MINQIVKIVSEVLHIQANEDTSQNNCGKWDSLHHLNIIVALEETFDIYFEPEDIAKIKSIKDIEKTILKYKEGL